MKTNLLPTLILLAGLGQLAVAATSVFIPFLLGWKDETARLRPLTRQVFWTYTGYTLAAHIWFAVISIFGARWLTDGSQLAVAITAYISVYWLARIAVQFFWYDRTVAAGRPLFRVAEVLYVMAFAGFGVIYALAAAHNLGAVLG